MKIGTREATATLLGCVLSVFVFAVGQAAACGCDDSGDLTDDGRYEVDFGSLSVEPEPASDGKATSSVSMAGNDGGMQTVVLQYETSETDSSELADFLTAAGENLNCGSSIFCAAAAPSIASQGCAAGGYVAAGDLSMTKAAKGGCAAAGKVL